MGGGGTFGGLSPGGASVIGTLIGGELSTGGGSLNDVTVGGVEGGGAIVCGSCRRR
jgi:hypothetical protein